MSAALAIFVLIVAVIIFMAISKNIRVTSFNGLSGFFDAYWKIFGVSLIISYFICSIFESLFNSIFSFVWEYKYFIAFIIIGLMFSNSSKKTNENSIDDEDYNKLANVIATHLKIDTAKINLDSNFIDDLGADSLDLVELTMELEDAFGIEISDKEAQNIKIVNEALQYIKSHKPKKEVQDNPTWMNQPAAKPKEEEIKYCVFLMKAGENKDRIAKILNEETKISLAKAKKIVDEARPEVGGRLILNSNLEKCNAIKAKLEEAGATIDMS